MFVKLKGALLEGQGVAPNITESHRSITHEDYHALYKTIEEKDDDRSRGKTIVESFSAITPKKLNGIIKLVGEKCTVGQGVVRRKIAGTDDGGGWVFFCGLADFFHAIANFFHKQFLYKIS